MHCVNSSLANSSQIQVEEVQDEVLVLLAQCSKVKLDIEVASSGCGVLWRALGHYIAVSCGVIHRVQVTLSV
eukprot:6232383-Amphidinium_carterae.1